MPQKINIDDISMERTTSVSAKAIEVMAADIAKRGLQTPLLVDHHHLLIDGLTRLRALQSMGATEVDVEVVETLEKAIPALQKRIPVPANLSVRRRRDLAESLDSLISAHISRNLSRRGKHENVPKNMVGTRELVAGALGYTWHRLRRITRWIEEDPRDPIRKQMMEGLENRIISINSAYIFLSGAKAGDPRLIDALPPKAMTFAGDIVHPRGQQHVLEELNRQLSGAMKGSTKLGFPILVPQKELQSMLNEMIKHRRRLTIFIQALRKEIDDDQTG